MIEAIIFDMDGVLFDTERLIGECWQSVADEMELGNIESLLHTCIGVNKLSTRSIFKEQLGENFDFDLFDHKVHTTFFDRVEVEGLPMKVGVCELLTYLKESGYKIGLASSTQINSVKSHLQRTELEDYFEVIVGGDMVKKGKPDPEIYLTACHALGVIPEHAIAIEDSYNGVRAAAAAGVRTIMVPDLLPVTDEMKSLIYAHYDSLIEVMKGLQG